MLQLSAKLQNLISDYDDANCKLARLLMKDNHEEMPLKSKEVDMVNIMGIGDRVVIPLRIKLPNVEEHTLDAQIDSGAMCTCCKYGAIPSYYWQPTKLVFRAANKELMEINHISPYFPIFLNNVQTYVTLYSFDTGSDVLLGQDFLKIFLPVTFGKDSVTFTTLEGPVQVQAKNDFQIKVKPTNEDKIQDSLQDLSKIQKIIKNVELHGQSTLQAISDKLRRDCTSNRPDAFWTREKYFVALPYKEGYISKPQKASANHMSPNEQDLFKQEIK